MPYRYALLRPLRAADADAHNAPLLGLDSFGIEVTEPELAGRCGLGNLDPQHSGARLSISAIAAARTIALPPAGAMLVTIRPDADALGAMAVLSLRARNIPLHEDTLRRIGLIDAADCFANGAWPCRRPLPRCAEEIDEVGAGPEGAGAMGLFAMDAHTPLPGKIAAFERWLLRGEAPTDALVRGRNAAEELFAALANGALKLDDVLAGRLAYVTGHAPGGLKLAYRLAPVVVGETRLPPAGARKLTIAQYTRGYADFSKLEQRLGQMEPGWGGTSTILGSPQGASCTLRTQDIVEIVLDTLSRDVVNSSPVAGGG